MALDKEFYFDILTNVRKYNGTLTYAKNEQLICALSFAESREVFLSWLDSVEKTNPIDLEMVRYAAMICSSLDRLDIDVLAWIKVNPVEERYEIGFSFFSGYWAAGHKPSDACLTFLITMIEGDCQKRSDAYAYALTALYVVADPVDNMEIAEQARRELSGILINHVQYLEENNLHPEVAESLRKLRDFEKRKFYAIFDTAKDMDPSRLNGKKLSDIVNALVSWLEIWSKPGWFDLERMMFAGDYLGCTGRVEFGQAVCDWVCEEQTQERLAVAAAFLSTYWQKFDTKPVCIGFLQQALTRFAGGTDAHRAITLAISIMAEKAQTPSGHQN